MYRQWLNKNVRYVKDLFSEGNDSFLSFENFKTKYDINCNILHYHGLIRAIPKNWKRLMFTNNVCLLNDDTNTVNDRLFQAK